MMKLIKFCLWVAATLVIAYFLADFKVGGETIKQKVDHFFKGSLSSKAKNLIGDTGSGNNPTIISESHRPPQEDIKASDQHKLEKILVKEQ